MSSTARRARRARRSCSCCTASRPPATCSATSSRCSPTVSISSRPICRASATPICRTRANTFDRIAETIDRFTETIGFDRYAVYVFDYGAPTGFRLAVKHPDRITAIISQNGNAYEEGLSDGWKPIRAYWQDPSPANREALRTLPQAGDDASGNIPTACPTRRASRPTATRSTISTWPGPARPTCSST